MKKQDPLKTEFQKGSTFRNDTRFVLDRAICKEDQFIPLTFMKKEVSGEHIDAVDQTNSPQYSGGEI